MKISIGFIISSLITASAYGVLPPLYETAAEFKSLIESKELIEKLDSGEAIMSITRSNKGFVVLTNKHSLDVDVIYDPTGRPGPSHYHLIFKDPQPIEH